MKIRIFLLRSPIIQKHQPEVFSKKVFVENSIQKTFFTIVTHFIITHHISLIISIDSFSIDSGSIN